MIYKLHYWLITSGACAIVVLIGVFMQTYTDASHWELGLLFMSMPFLTMIAKPIICSKADREMAHRSYLLTSVLVVALSYSPFVIIPLLGPAVYGAHPRICWYVLVVLKMIGDIAFVCAITLGDALAINYARRVGDEFGEYRVWGTVSWMSFGVLIGAINELPFLPRFVPAFLILIFSCLLNAFVIWLWPAEYFRMVQISDEELLRIEADPKRGQLMPRKLLFAHMKSKFCSIFSGICFKSTNTIDNNSFSPNEKLNVKLQEHQKNNQSGNIFLTIDLKKQKDNANCKNFYQSNLRQVAEKDSTVVATQMETTMFSGKQGLELSSNMDTLMEKLKQVEASTGSKTEIQLVAKTDIELAITKKQQLQILWTLAKAKPMFFCYIIIFAFIGLGQVGLFFFFMDLENVCKTEGTCSFSQMAGYVQLTMASSETLLFFYIKSIKKYLSHDDMCTLAFLCNSVKWLFYGFYWHQVDPRWTLLVECLHGLNYGFYLILVVEVSQRLAAHVVHLIPDLTRRGIINESADTDKLQSSLSATMQAIMSSCTDGLGRGIGSLIAGFIIELYSFQTLWLILGIKSTLALCIMISFNIYKRCKPANSSPKDGAKDVTLVA